MAFIDFHGHSAKPNIFSYGPEYQNDNFHYYMSKFIPDILQKRTDMFDFSRCSFVIPYSKRTTARATFFNDFGVENCYTFEASFGNYINKTNNKISFSSTAYQ